MVQCDSLAVAFLWPELEIFSVRRMLDVQVWHRIRPSWWRSRLVVSGGMLDPFKISVAPYKMAMVEASTLTMIDLSYINSTMFIVFRHSWAYLFNDDPGRFFFSAVLINWLEAEIWKSEVVKLVASILPILGLFQVFDGWSAVTGGILRAKGKQVPTFALKKTLCIILLIPLI